MKVKSDVNSANSAVIYYYFGKFSRCVVDLMFVAVLNSFENVFFRNEYHMVSALSFANVRLTDNGSYACVARDLNGTLQFQKWELTVNRKLFKCFYS